MNKIINKYLLTGDKFMPEFRLKQLAFTQSPCGPFTKNRERIQEFRETGNLKHLYRNAHAHDAIYSDSKDLVKITISDKILKDKADEIAKNCEHNGCQRALASMAYKFYDKKVGSRIIVKEQLAKELHKRLIKKFYTRFKDNIWVAVLTEMELLFPNNKNVRYSLCFIDVFTRHAWVKPLKGKKSKTVLNPFIEIVNESNRKENKFWDNQGRGF